MKIGRKFGDTKHEIMFYKYTLYNKIILTKFYINRLALLGFLCFLLVCGCFGIVGVTARYFAHRIQVLIECSLAESKSNDEYSIPPPPGGLFFPLRDPILTSLPTLRGNLRGALALLALS